jgi:hypothetical protein
MHRRSTRLCCRLYIVTSHLTIHTAADHTSRKTEIRQTLNTRMSDAPTSSRDWQSQTSHPSPTISRMATAPPSYASSHSLALEKQRAEMMNTSDKEPSEMELDLKSGELGNSLTPQLGE